VINCNPFHSFICGSSMLTQKIQDLLFISSGYCQCTLKSIFYWVMPLTHMMCTNIIFPIQIYHSFKQPSVRVTGNSYN
jgi:hypothetical protein